METTQIEEHAGTLTARSAVMLVVDALSYEAAAEFLLDIKTYRKQLGETFDPIVRKAHAAHKEALAQKQKHEQPAIHAEKIVMSRMLEWRQAEKARADAEAREAEVEARRRAEEEQLAAAEAAEKAGDKAAAEAIVSEAPVVAPVLARPAVPKVAGISVRDNWSAEVTNFADLVRAVADGKVPTGVLLPNMPTLNSLARSMKGELRFPGVRAVCAQGMAAGRR